VVRSIYGKKHYSAASARAIQRSSLLRNPEVPRAS
jgi:hypothetical protein